VAKYLNQCGAIDRKGAQYPRLRHFCREEKTAETYRAINETPAAFSLQIVLVYLSRFCRKWRVLRAPFARIELEDFCVLGDDINIGSSSINFRQRRHVYFGVWPPVPRGISTGSALFNELPRQQSHPTRQARCCIRNVWREKWKITAGRERTRFSRY